MKVKNFLLWGVSLVIFITTATYFQLHKNSGFAGPSTRKSKPETFACAVICMDGRVQEIVKNYMKAEYKVDWVDIVTEPGPNKILCECTEKHVVDNIKKRLEISVNHHKSKVVAIAGHEECAGNPVPKEEHIRQLKEDKKTVQAFGLAVKITLLWIAKGWKTVEVVE